MTDRLNGPAWMKVLGVFLLVSFGGMIALAVVLTREIGVAPATLTMLPSVLVLAVGLLLVTASVRVEVDDHIELRFVPIWRRRIDYRDVATVEIADQTWYRFGGVGLRWKGDATGLILGNRPAVVLRTRDEHEYVVQCRDPARVAESVRARMGAR
ncbi:hypothetical protein [Curtobacterium sp. 1310]|jgi:hypothetical protein|uniref:hypothetical protein n=1 Tax=Curtobacterium sp. 1310 TaxID=2806570 RepID=UPI001AE165C4|nr:hypothetical protein [Curtobacterium sp. 1310]MBP1301650.1 hypothetical protein [Curtobacterium sp. 1310]